MSKRRPDDHDVYKALITGCIDPDLVSPENWLIIIRKCLESSKSVLSDVARKNRDSRFFAGLLDYQLVSENGCRITDDSIKDSISKALLINDHWIFVPVDLLDSNEKEGLFSETSLFLLADWAFLVIIETKFRKIKSESKMKCAVVNEVVESCHVIFDSDSIKGGSTKQFSEMILPYFSNKRLELGKRVINFFFDDVVLNFGDMIRDFKKIEKEMSFLLKVRERLGFVNCLPDK